MITAARLAVVVLVWTIAIPGAFAKQAKPTFLPFKGNFRGTVTLQVPNVFSGPANISFRVPKKGTKGTMNVSGAINGITTSLVSVLNFTKKTCSISDFIFNIEGTGNFSGTGIARLKKKTITFNGAWSIEPAYTFTGFISTRTKGRKQTLSFVYTIFNGGAPILTLTFETSRKVKKN